MNPPLHSLVFTQALGWTIVHSVWQIACIFLIFKVFCWMIGPRNIVRYYGSVLAMGTCAAWSMFTFANLYYSFKIVVTRNTNQTFEKFSAIPHPTASLISISENTWQTVEQFLNSYSAILGWLWCVGVVILSIRLLGGYWLSNRLKRRSQPIKDKDVAVKGQLLAKQLGIEKLVNFLENAHISAPVTLGFWKPVVLFPVGLLVQFTPAQVEVLLLHELAHIRRHDYLINLFQLVLEVCFFYHPLFWLLSRDARTTREYCCDDLVLRHTANPLLYAHTLTSIKLISIHHQNVFAMSAIGKNSFTARIQRILGVAPHRTPRAQPLFLLLLLAGLIIGAAWPTISEASPKNDSITQTSDLFLVVPARDSVVPRPFRTKPVSAPKAAPAPAPIVINNPSPRIDTIIFMYLNGHVYDAILSKQAFLDHPEVIAVRKIGEKEERLTVLSYEVTVLPNNATDAFSFISSKGSIENEQFSTTVRTLAPDSKIYIDNVEIKVPGEDKPVNLGGLIFKIKE